VEHFQTHPEVLVVSLDNRFLDPLGQPNVYSEDGRGVSSALLHLEALACNGSYHRDIRMVVAVSYSSELGDAGEGDICGRVMLCEVVVEMEDMHRAVTGEDVSQQEDIQWNKEAELLLQARREQAQPPSQEGNDGGTASESLVCDEATDDCRGDASSACNVTKTKAFYAGFMQDYFTKFRSWSRGVTGIIDLC
jgi:hypothetical protein